MKFESGYGILEKNKNRKSDKNCVLKNKTAIRLLKAFENDNEVKLSELRIKAQISEDYAKMILNGYLHRWRDKTYKYNGLVMLNLVSKRKFGANVLCRITQKGKEFLRNLEMT